MQAPPPTGTTGKAPPRVGLLGAGSGAGAALEIALAAMAAGPGALGCAAPTAAAHPIIKTESPTLARSAIAEVLLPAIPTLQMNCSRIRVTYGAGATGAGASCGWPPVGAGLWRGTVPGQVTPRMHPQSRPIMQPPGSGSGASLAGTTGKAPPPVRPPGSPGGTGILLDRALVAGVSGVGALGCAATAAPHPTIKTNMATTPREAIAVLPLFMMLPNCMSSM
jgi:hypothetical protein